MLMLSTSWYLLILGVLQYYGVFREYAISDGNEARSLAFVKSVLASSDENVLKIL